MARRVSSQPGHACEGHLGLVQMEIPEGHRFFHRLFRAEAFETWRGAAGHGCMKLANMGLALPCADNVTSPGRLRPGVAQPWISIPPFTSIVAPVM